MAKQNGIKKAANRVVIREMEVSNDPVLTNCVEQVDSFLKAKRNLDKAKASYQTALDDVVKPARYEYVKRGGTKDHTKSVDLAGSTSDVKVTFSDKFKELPANDDLKKSAGGSFDKYFMPTRKIELQKTDDETIGELIEALGPDKFQDIFKIKLTYKTKPGFDRDQFSAPVTVRNLAEQYAPQVKVIKK